MAPPGISADERKETRKEARKGKGSPDRCDPAGLPSLSTRPADPAEPCGQPPHCGQPRHPIR
ncbi:hypothetical protein GCM10010253_46010 [Streptomyces badius]|uniref:Uncharacterized protein n=1 Tax=Streptomyces badius TaxID=1941 RepID=A0ABQ2TE53_STRBA|nr:hypothetical protein GCM10010253_46010 [Streptomyces badius]